jgi:hypothetical protein
VVPSASPITLTEDCQTSLIQQHANGTSTASADLEYGDALLYDEPGRCGGIDSHHLDLRVVKNCGAALLYRFIQAWRRTGPVRLSASTPASSGRLGGNSKWTLLGSKRSLFTAQDAAARKAHLWRTSCRSPHSGWA